MEEAIFQPSKKIDGKNEGNDKSPISPTPAAIPSSFAPQFTTVPVSCVPTAHFQDLGDFTCAKHPRTDGREANDPLPRSCIAYSLPRTAAPRN